MTTENRSQGLPGEEDLPRFEKVRGRDGNWYLACGEVITFLFEYLEESVAPERRLEFDRHLAVCPSCRNYLATYRDSLLLAKRTSELDEVEIPEVPQHLLEAILKLRK
jgi:predicted anti-sigma-YlaC factor YlaD